VDLFTLRELMTPAGQEAIEVARALSPGEADFLIHFQTLVRSHPRELARAALEIAILRTEAQAKYPFAEVMYFTREALQQASSWDVSTYRARRFQGFGSLLDLGCSIGGDTLALVGVAPTIGIDLDPLRLVMAHENVRALNAIHPVAFLQADLSAPLPLSPLPSSTALYFDPARRADGRRLFSVQDYHPPLSVVRDWLASYPALGVKLSPGVHLDEIAGYEAELEFISLRGELKEAVLWFGPLKTTSRRATILPGPHSMVSDSDSQQSPPLAVDEPRPYIYEPDPAILRAGLVRDLGVQLDAVQLDPDIAYLTADERKPTPFARAWVVEDWFPFGLKRLRATLRERGVGRVTVKKRGSPIQPEELIRDLRLSGESERVIFLTHLRGKPITIIALPIRD
jgi:hypothetical protein